MMTGDRLLVPSRVALKVDAHQGTIILTCSKQNNRNEKTHNYPIL